jgi:hypothetical protein
MKPHASERFARFPGGTGITIFSNGIWFAKPTTAGKTGGCGVLKSTS